MPQGEIMYSNIAQEFANQILEFSILAFACCALGAWFGFKYRGTKAKERLCWSLVELCWWAVSAFAIGKILTPVEDGFTAAVSFEVKMELGMKQRRISDKVWEAQDKFCSQPTGAATHISIQCDSLHKIERSVVAPYFTHVSALVIERDLLPIICSKSHCDPEIEVIRREIEDFQRLYLANRMNIEKSPNPGEHKIGFAYCFMLVFILALGAKLGRVVAEICRSIDDLGSAKKLMDVEPEGEPVTTNANGPESND